MVSLTQCCSSWMEHENIPQFLKAIYHAKGLLFTDDKFISALLSAFLLVFLSKLTTAEVVVVGPEIQKLYFRYVGFAN